jgi:DNA (cytosine-5)-methyltransferase 1
MHLFAGAGGGILGDLILGHVPVCAVEQAAYPCSVLRDRFPWLHVHEGDIRAFDPLPWLGRVDCLHAGFPCQDISCAGSGAGLDGERSSLFFEVARIAGFLRPAWVFLENSPNIRTRGLDRVLRTLADLRYDAEWMRLGAADVGAPHRRWRWWCLARRADTNNPGQPASSGRKETPKQGNDAGGMGSDVANPAGVRRDETSQERGKHSERRGDETLSGGEIMANMHREGREVGEQRDAGKRPAVVGGSWWSVEPDVGRVAYGVADRMDRISAIGNGQVPLCAAAAFRILQSRFDS